MANKKVKIVATIGPVSADKNMLKALIKSGVNVFRLNFSHGNDGFFEKLIADIRLLSDDVAILADMPGPKIRTGKFGEGKKEIVLKKSEKIVLTDENILTDNQKIYIDYPYLSKDIKSGSLVYIDDGKIKIRVIKVLNERELLSEILVGGVLKPEKGINFPNVFLSIPSITEKDFEHIRFAADHDVDMIAVSFVRSPEDIRTVKKFLKFNYPAKDFFVIAKIEKVEALEHIEKIAEASDGIMVARGDLGVEAPIEEIPLEQKRIISVANFYKKPVITATQMLMSMVQNDSPTRAEVTDISNAIFDGTDAVMLSEETAIGDFPIDAVRYMERIIETTEKSSAFKRFKKNAENYCLNKFNNDRDLETSDNFEAENTSEIIAKMAVMASRSIENSIIVAITRSGYTANLISSLRPCAKVIAIVSDSRVKRRLALNYGVESFVMENIVSGDIDIKDVTNFIKQKIKFNKKYYSAVLTGGVPLGEPGSTDFVKIVRL